MSKWKMPLNVFLNTIMIIILILLEKSLYWLEKIDLDLVLFGLGSLK